MKKTLKIAGWTLLSLVAVLLVAVCVAVYVVFTPARLTPIVRNYLPQFVTCDASVGEADLTFFSTFPQFGVRLTDVCLRNPQAGAPSDTLAYVGLLVATVDAWVFLTEDALLIDEVLLDGGYANIYIDSTGHANYDVMVPSDSPTDTAATALPFDVLKLELLKINNLRVSYTDEQAHLCATVGNVGLGLLGRLADDASTAQMHLRLENVACTLADSTPMEAALSRLDLRAKIDMLGKELFGDVVLDLQQTDFTLGGDRLLRQADITLAAPFKANTKTLYAQLDKAKFAIDGHEIGLDGWAQKSGGDITTDMSFATNVWSLTEIMALIPDTYANLLDGIEIGGGEAVLDGRITGVYNDNHLPAIVASVDLNKGRVAMDGVPYKLHGVSLKANADLDLNDGGVCRASIVRLKASTGDCSVAADGRIDDLLGKMRCNLHLNADLALPELAPMMPDSLNLLLQGRCKADLRAKFALDDATALNLEKIAADGTLIFSGLKAVYDDSLLLCAPQMKLAVAMPCKPADKFDGLLWAHVDAPDLKVEMPGTLDAALTDADINITTSNILDTTAMLSAQCDFGMKRLTAHMDTIAADIVAPKGQITLSPSRRNPKLPHLRCTYSSETLCAKMGSALDVDTKFVNISASTTYDETQENTYLKLNPTLKVDFNDGAVRIGGVEPVIQIPAIKFAFTPRKFRVDDSRIVIDRSDFKLTGEARNIRKFMRGDGLIEGEFDFVSDKTDIDQLMSLVSGFGQTDSVSTETPTEIESPAADDDPFMVPKGVDIALNTHIKNALFAGNSLQNIGGKLTVKDGVLVLEQMGFTCDAAEMQLTAMYRSERRNHLFAGLDFHLLNIDIRQLIHMVPDIDTIFPMLKSFEGRAQFHLAAETYLKSNYDIKFSTLRGAAAIEGKDLVLLDSETFGKIAKPLLFSRKTRNMVDSVSVEATVFRDEVDLYPFVMSLDKYSAVVAGRYDLANNYNAHIETLAPVRLALQVKGNASDLDNMQFKLVKTKYSDMYKPEKRNVTQERILELKKLISDSLKQNVK